MHSMHFLPLLQTVRVLKQQYAYAWALLYRIFQCISGACFPKFLPVRLILQCDLYMHKTMHAGTTNMRVLLSRVQETMHSRFLKKIESCINSGVTTGTDIRS